jgi:P pilus assembly chaperone PapD
MRLRTTGLFAIVLGATYQPVTYGMAAAAVQGPVSVRIVNDFGGLRGQIYIPPQPATDGALLVSLTNTGPYRVTIESVSIIANGEPSYPTALNNQTGPATYVPLAAPGLGPQVTGSSPKIADVTLRPGENVLIRIPFRTPICWGAGRSMVSDVWVTPSSCG